MTLKTLSITLVLFLFSLPVNAQVVAIIGQDTLTLTDFRVAYLDVVKKPGIFDSKELREKVLNDLIDGRLLATEARKTGLLPDERIKNKVNHYGNKVLREIHYDRVIKSGIKVTEAANEEAYQFTQEQRKISHLFFKTKKQADSVYALIKAGQPFEKLAATVFKNDEKLAATGGDLGWVYWDQLDYDLGITAFRLPVDSISSPVKSPFGYHIVKVTSWKKNPLITRQQYELSASKTKVQLVSKIGEKMAAEYLSSLAKRSKIQLFPEALKKLQTNLEGKFKRQPNQMDQAAEIQLSDQEIKVIESGIEDIRNLPVASVNGKIITASDFAGAMTYLPYSVLYSGFGNTVDYVLRDELVNQESVQMGFDRSDTVRAKTELFETQLLELDMRWILIRSVTITDDEVRAWFELKKGNYPGADFETMKEILHTELLNLKKQQAVPEFVTEKKKEIPVTKNVTIINDYYDRLLKR